MTDTSTPVAVASHIVALHARDIAWFVRHDRKQLCTNACEQNTRVIVGGECVCVPNAAARRAVTALTAVLTAQQQQNSE